MSITKEELKKNPHYWKHLYKIEKHNRKLAKSSRKLQIERGNKFAEALRELSDAITNADIDYITSDELGVAMQQAERYLQKFGKKNG